MNPLRIIREGAWLLRAALRLSRSPMIAPSPDGVLWPGHPADWENDRTDAAMK